MSLLCCRYRGACACVSAWVRVCDLRLSLLTDNQGDNIENGIVKPEQQQQSDGVRIAKILK